MKTNKKYGYIYRITFPNGDSYIGKHQYGTKGEILDASREKDLNYFGSGNELGKLYKKYGKNQNFIEVIDDTARSRAELNSLEQQYILMLEPTLNHNLGGDGGLQEKEAYVKGWITRKRRYSQGFSEAGLIKIRAANKEKIPYNKGKTWEELFGEEKAALLKKKNNYWISHEYPDSAKLKISQSLKGIQRDDKTMEKIRIGNATKNHKEILSLCWKTRRARLKNPEEKTRTENLSPYQKFRDTHTRLHKNGIYRKSCEFCRRESKNV